MEKRIISALIPCNEHKAGREIVQPVDDAALPFILAMAADNLMIIRSGYRKKSAAIDCIPERHRRDTALLPPHEGVRTFEDKIGLSRHFLRKS